MPSNTIDNLLTELEEFEAELARRKQTVSPARVLLNVYHPPANNKFGSISILSDAFGGFAAKVSYNIFGKRIKKRKHLVLANSTIYIFGNDDPNEDYEEKYPVVSSTVVKQSEKDSLTLLIYTESKRSTHQANPRMTPLKLEVIDKHKLELEFFDHHEFLVWVDCFEEAVGEAKRGRRPMTLISLQKEQNSSNESRKFSKQRADSGNYLEELEYLENLEFIEN